MKLTRTLYRLARLSNDLGALTSGSPKRIRRRAANKVKGRILQKIGFWRWLWK
jgi:hypothetical protein